MNKTEMENKLRATLKPSRFIHSIGVRDTAVKMAELFGCDIEKAYIAGLLHDCAKYSDRQGEWALCEKYGFVPDKATAMCPPVLHAPLGAIVAEREYGVTDTGILDAIRYHTVARWDMTLLDKIIYVADMAEPNRDYEGVEDLRRLAYTDIDAAFCEAVRQSLVFNIAKGAVIHPNTLDAWNNIHKKQ